MSDKIKTLLSKIRRIQIRSSKAVEDILAGSYHSVFKGQGIEFDEVRGYIPGDDVRSIDWNVTARMNFPYVKSFREERELTVNLLVDISSSQAFGSGGRLKSEWIAEIGATLAFSAIENGDKVGLILFSNQVELYIPPKKGTKHVLRVIRELLTFEPNNRGTSLAKGLDFLSRVQKKKGICFLISDFMDQNFEKELTLASKRHDLIAICVSDPFEEALPDVGRITFFDLETGEEGVVHTGDPSSKTALFEDYSLRQKEGKRLLKKLGAGWIPIRLDESYIDALQKYFLGRGKKR